MTAILLGAVLGTLGATAIDYTLGVLRFARGL